MKILVIGDSFSYGEELPGVDYYNPSTGILNPSVNAWPSVLGKMIGATVTNLSIPAGSNDRIFRLAIDNLCAGCPVSRTCFAVGISTKEWGVWGGIYLVDGEISKEFNPPCLPITIASDGIPSSSLKFSSHSGILII